MKEDQKLRENASDSYRSERIYGLDVLRAVAIVAVVLAHSRYLVAPEHLNFLRRYPTGTFGVECFFALSGYLIGGILLRSADRLALPGELRRFWARRWLRTLPNYVLFLAVNIALAVYLGYTVPPLWPFLTFTQSALLSPEFFGESWSLAVEEWFYLVFPLALWLAVRRRPGHASTAVLGIALAFLILPTVLRLTYVLLFDPPWDFGVRKVTPLRLDALMYGVLAAWCAQRWPDGWRRWRDHIGGLGIALLVVLIVTLDVSNLNRSIFARTLLLSLLPMAFACLLPWASYWRVAQESAATGVVRSLARWSYALYLTNLPAYLVLRDLVPRPHDPLSAAGLLAAYWALAIAAAALVYRYWERPFLLWRDQLSAAEYRRVTAQPTL